MSVFRWLRWAPLVLAGVGLLLLVVALAMPAHSNEAAFQVEMARIDAMQGQYDVGPDFDAMSRAFHAAHDRFGTPKWLVMDLGLASLAWSALLALVFRQAGRGGWRSVTHTRRGIVVPVLLAAALLLMQAGLYAEGLIPLARGQVPRWADSTGTLFMQIAAISILVVPLLALPVLLALLRGPPPFPLVARPTAPYWPTALVTLIFLPPLLVAAMLMAMVWTQGGWATSPAGALLVWLLLNARGLLIAPSRPAAA